MHLVYKHTYYVLALTRIISLYNMPLHGAKVVARVICVIKCDIILLFIIIILTRCPKRAKRLRNDPNPVSLLCDNGR